MLEKPFRSHISIIVENIIKSIWAIILIFLYQLSNIFTTVENTAQTEITNTEKFALIGGLLIIILLVGIFYFLRWRKTYITLTKEFLTVERKVIFSNKTEISLKNISTVDLEQNIIERILKTYRIKIDTNSQSTAEKTDVNIVLKKKEAEAFKTLILATINNTAPQENVKTIEEDEKFDIEYNSEQIIKHFLYSISVFVVLLVIATICFMIFAYLNPNLIGDTEVSTTTILLSSLVWILPVIISGFKSIANIFDLKVKRQDDKIRIKHGLITKKDYLLPVEKINAIRIRQTFISRIFNRYSVEAINIGRGEEKEERPILLLMSKKEELKNQLEKILPEYVKEINIEHQKSSVCIINLIVNLIISSVIAIIIKLISNTWFGLLIIPIMLIFSFMRYKTQGYGINKEDYIVVINGIFGRRIVITKLEKIHKMSIIRGPIVRALKLGKLQFGILSRASERAYGTGAFDIKLLNDTSEKYSKTLSDL